MQQPFEDSPSYMAIYTAVYSEVSLTVTRWETWTMQGTQQQKVFMRHFIVVHFLDATSLATG